MYPSLTVAEHLRDEELCEVTYVGTADGLEARLAADAGIPFYAVPARGFDRGAPISAVPAFFTALFSWVRCLSILNRRRPDVVVGFGGYVSVPLGLAAITAGVPLVLHEQNAEPGLANKVLSRWARRVCVTYPGTAVRFARLDRVVVTGNPVRPEVVSANRASGRKALGLDKGDLVLLVFGGSRGARHLNNAVLDLYQRLMDMPKLKVVHVAGPQEVEAVRSKLAEVSGGDTSRWQVYDYIDRMGDALAAADLVVCRAGATSIAEITALGRAAVLVPYPFATADHQTRNAEALVRMSAAVMVRDGELESPAFAEDLVRLLSHPKQRKAMGEAAAAAARPLAAVAIAETAIEEAIGYTNRVGGAAA